MSHLLNAVLAVLFVLAIAALGWIGLAAFVGFVVLGTALILHRVGLLDEVLRP